MSVNSAAMKQLFRSSTILTEKRRKIRNMEKITKLQKKRVLNTEWENTDDITVQSEIIQKFEKKIIKIS